jgi:ankyrin repeat protein
MMNVNDAWGPVLPNERLLWAARRGEENVLRQAIHAGASLYVRDRANRDTALHLAIQNGHFEIARILIEEWKFDADMRNNQNAPPVLTAVLFERFDIVQFLVSRNVAFAVQAIDLNDENIFHKAAMHGMPLALVQKVLESHPDAVAALEQRIKRGLTPAQEALVNKNCDLFLLFAAHVPRCERLSTISNWRKQAAGKYSNSPPFFHSRSF